MDQPSVTLPVLLSNQDLILDVEVGDVKLEVNILRDDEATDNIVHDLGDEAIVSAGWVDSTVVEHLFHVLRFGEGADELCRVSNVVTCDPLNIHVLIKEGVSVHYVEHMLESVLRLLSWMREFSQELRLNDWMRLGDDQIVSSFVLIESILQEVC